MFSAFLWTVPGGNFGDLSLTLSKCLNQITQCFVKAVSLQFRILSLHCICDSITEDCPLFPSTVLVLTPLLLPLPILRHFHYFTEYSELEAVAFFFGIGLLTS